IVFFWFIMLMNLLMPGRISLRAVDDVDLTIRKGHTMALVGESGCGKTTMGKSIIQLNKTTAGSVRYGGKELTTIKGEQLKPFRQKMQIIFQDPYGSLNPRQMIGEIIEEGMLVHGVGKTKEEREAIIRDVLRHVNMAPEMMTRYPHEFSGGQRQRIGIARVLAIQPDFVVCDEPTSALDVSVQAQILNLLNQLQDEFELTYLFITHDLRVVEFIADHLSVMYLGRIVEEGKTEEIFSNPKHPYTRALLTAIPETDPKSGFKKIKLEGDVPSPINPPRGCHFNPRCQYAMPICKAAYPGPIEETGTHKVRCFLYGTGEIDLPDGVKWDGRKELQNWDEERAKIRHIKEEAEEDRRSKLKNGRSKKKDVEKDIEEKDDDK
ncbi:MAG: ATP-binding cassette domain-containing protein, partial [Planctomycetes bacterium]|nr:ATP-binding cassette domain-containing protein [Planctomycetota bacterium]